MNRRRIINNSKKAQRTKLQLSLCKPFRSLFKTVYVFAKKVEKNHNRSPLCVCKNPVTKPHEHLCLLNKLSQLVIVNQSFICHLITYSITSITDINLLLLNPQATSTSVNNCYLTKHSNVLLNNCSDIISFKLFGKLSHIIAALNLTEKRLLLVLSYLMYTL